MDLIYYIDLFGTLVFAISGVLVAVEKKFDLVGAIIIGIVTAVGGGTLRDVLIGETPVGWMKDLNYLYVIFAAIPLCFFFQKSIQKLRRGIFLFDTIGIGLFTILGLQNLVGALVFLGLEYIFPALSYNIPVSIFVVIIIRYLAVRKNWALPFKPNS